MSSTYIHSEWFPKFATNIWEIDGEKFWPTLPYMRDIEQYSLLFQQEPALLDSILRAKPAQLDEDPTLPSICFKRSDIAGNVWLAIHQGKLSSHLGQERWFGYFLEGEFFTRENEFNPYLVIPVLDDWYWADFEDGVPWRPLLLPLDKSGNPDFHAKWNNPDGTIVTGGSLRYEGMGPGGIPIGMKNKRACTVGDSRSGEELSWIWVNGCLLSTHILGMISLLDLDDAGVLGWGETTPKL